MHIDILTLFPTMFEGPLNESILKRAQENNLISIKATNIRDYAFNKHKSVDDYPFGGGAGMVMKPEPIFEAFDDILSKYPHSRKRVLLMAPQGKVLNQALAKELSHEEHIIIICGHYEGIDDRVRQALITDEISIGDYVLTGGELPAMVVIDTLARMIPGVLGKEISAEDESFYHGLLEYPQYTRPRQYRGLAVPDILLSGDHKNIELWRRKKSLELTLTKRPDLIKETELSVSDQKLLTKEIKVKKPKKP
jgi:tRNA (guanine37-N1)-methyltransferase